MPSCKATARTLSPRRTNRVLSSVYLLLAFWLIRCINLNKVYTKMPERQQENIEKLRLFSERVRSRLARLGLQDNEVAEKLGVSPGAVGNWKAGRNFAVGETLRALADLLGASVAWLKGEDDERVIMPREQPQMAADSGLWRSRAVDAERKLNDLRQGLRSLLELSSPNPHPPRQVSSKPVSDAEGLLSAVEEGEVDPAEESRRSRGAGEPIAPASSPLRSASPAPKGKPAAPKPAPK